MLENVDAEEIIFKLVRWEIIGTYSFTLKSYSNIFVTRLISLQENILFNKNQYDVLCTHIREKGRDEICHTRTCPFQSQLCNTLKLLFGH